MNQTESLRLAHIRADATKWLSVEPGLSEGWDVVFLLRILDEKNERIRELEKGQ